MTSEKTLWSRLRACTTWGHIVRVENAVEVGTPDVNGCYEGREFWIELKVAHAPKRETSRVRVDHFTPKQRRWLYNRVEAGGNAFVLVQVDREYILLNGDVAALHLGYVPLKDLRDWSLRKSNRITAIARYIKGLS